MKTRAELIAMTNQELEEYEQSLLAQWTPKIALENQIDRLSTEHIGQLEIFKKLKNGLIHLKLSLNQKVWNALISY